VSIFSSKMKVSVREAVRVAHFYVDSCTVSRHSVEILLGGIALAMQAIPPILTHFCVAWSVSHLSVCRLSAIPPFAKLLWSQLDLLLINLLHG